LPHPSLPHLGYCFLSMVVSGSSDTPQIPVTP
jgi:hypothetical protein